MPDPAARRAVALTGLLALACAGPVGQAMRPDVGAPDAPTAAPPPSADAIAAADSFLVRLETSRGRVDVMLRRHWAPLGVARVGDAVAAGYYDGARFFRALRGFVVQWGIAADPALTAAWAARPIPDDPVTQSNRRGTVSFAAGGPDTRTVQLFVNLRDNARLDALGFAPLGEVVAGIDAVDAFYTGYGEGAPSGQGPTQRALGTEGEPYLARDFPLLDRIVTARVVRAWPAAPAPSGAAPPSAAGGTPPSPP